MTLAEDKRKAGRNIGSEIALTATKPKGRPSKFKPAYSNDVCEHLAEGFTLASWAGTIGVHRDTLYEWADVHADFSDAIKRGRSKGMLVWEKRLRDQALKAEGNTASIIFAMKNLYKDDWADRIVNEHTGRDGGPIETRTLNDFYPPVK